MTTLKLSTAKFVFPPTMTWSRDYYLREDCNLMSALGLLAQTEAAVIQHQLDPTQALEMLSGMDGDVTFCTDDIGGMVSMPWNQFYYLYSDPASVTLLNTLKNLRFTSYPGGARGIDFHYQVGPLQTMVTKTFMTK